MHEALVELSAERPGRLTRRPTIRSSAPGQHLVVEEEVAELTYRDGVYQTRIRRQLRNTGSAAGDPVPDPDRGGSLPGRPGTLEPPLPGGPADVGGDRVVRDVRRGAMSWHVKHDRDAFKEVWLLFENRTAGSRCTRVNDVDQLRLHVIAAKWGPWWARAIRLPTRRLSMTVVFPARLQPVVWGIMTR